MRRKHNARNERIKRKYCIWLKDARRKAQHTVDQALAAISLFEGSTDCRDFAAFHIEQVRAFKRRLTEEHNTETGKPYALATVKGRLDAVKAFLLWLADQSGYRSRIRYADCEYFNMSANEARIATAKRERPAPDIDQVHRAIDLMPDGTIFEKRDRAILAFALLTGARDDALASLSICHVDLGERKVFQDARTVRTKFGKTFPTWFFPVGGKAEAITLDWLDRLRSVHYFGADDPLFPKTEVGLDANGQFAPVGLKREHWANADAIRRVFRRAFEAAGLPAFQPHTIRKTLVRFGEKICRTPEEFKAWSQNLGHEDVMTTFRSYGDVPGERQGAIMRRLASLGRSAETSEKLARARALLEEIGTSGLA
jgi:integrase